MIRECDFEDISDGRRYNLNDMVKLDTCDCEGCHKCCTNVGNTIVLDPYDLIELKKVTGKGLQDLLSIGYIELNMVDGIILPNIKMNDNNCCSFLNDEGRCNIHGNRPGICRLFPLGRIYNENGFDYFLQKDECAKELRAKIKIKKWLGITNIDKYQKYIYAWHDFIKNVGMLMIEYKNSGMGEKINDIAMYVLNTFFVSNIDASDENIFEVLMDRINDSRKVLLNK